MIEALLSILILWVLVVVTWVLYICAMQLKYHRKELYPVVRFHAYILAGVTILLDVVVNVIVSIPLLESPRWDLGEFLLSPRLQRLRNEQGETWRGAMAAWLCEHMLNQFDRSGDHC